MELTVSQDGNLLTGRVRYIGKMSLAPSEEVSSWLISPKNSSQNSLIYVLLSLEIVPYRFVRFFEVWIYQSFAGKYFMCSRFFLIVDAIR